MAFRRSTVRLRSAPLMWFRSDSKAARFPAWRAFLVVAVLSAALFTAGGCADSQHRTTYSSPTGIERPAQPIEDEESATDKAGNVGVVLLVVGGALAVLVLPLLFL
jgi:hypothetical protein